VRLADESRFAKKSLFTKICTRPCSDAASGKEGAERQGGNSGAAGFLTGVILAGEVQDRELWGLGGQYAFAAGNLTDGVSYTIRSQAKDDAGNTEPLGSGVTVTFDTTAPSSTISFPTAGSYSSGTWTGALSGTASDSGATPSGVNTVQVSIRQGTGNYWNGGAFGSVTESFFNASGTTTWSYGFAFSSFPAPGSYTVHAKATDTSTNVESPGPSVTFTVTLTGALDHFMVTAPGFATAGAPFNITLTAQDGSNNTITNYAGTVTLTSPDGQAVLPAPYTFVPGDNGVHTFTAGVTLKTAGTQTVTATDSGAGRSGTSGAIVVAAGALDHILVSPASATITAGDSQSYAVTGYDAYGNSKGDVTAATTFTVTNGTCNGNSCTSTVVGTQTVAGNDSGKTATASLQVNPAALDHITISPASATITAGATQLNAAEGFDQYGNSRSDVTASTTFSISPDGSCTGASCTTTVAGTHTVTGNDSGKTAIASLQVNAALQVSITQPSPGATVPAGMLLVRGTIEAGGVEAGVSVNGVPAAIQGSIFAALVPVASDTTTVTATGTTASGATASSSVAITVSSTSGDAIELVATPFSGVPPGLPCRFR
jgi:hypothetical protein